MTLESLREEVLEADFEVVRRAIVLYTFSNSNGIARDQRPGAARPGGLPAAARFCEIIPKLRLIAAKSRSVQ